MVPSNAIQRTFRIAYGDSAATCFTLDVDGRQYIVTARHVVPNAADTLLVRVHYNRQWQDLQCQVVGLATGEVDIAVLAPPHQLSPAHIFEPTTREMYLSQDAYFLGFPYGLHSEVGEINGNFPLPLVKKACVSMLAFGVAETKLMLLDGHNNPGFSGGPVVYAPPSQLAATRVAGVISGYHHHWESVYLGDDKTDLKYKYNTGIIVVYSIDYAIELIRANPIGAPLGDANV